MIITAGHGAFEPRRLGVEDIDEWLGRGLLLRRPGEGAVRRASAA